jgi:hypothetical protein
MSKLPAHTWDGETAVMGLQDFILLCMREGQFTWRAEGEEEFQRHLGDLMQPTDTFGPVLANEAAQARGAFRFAAMDDWSNWEGAPPFAFEVGGGRVRMPRADLQRLSAFLSDRSLPWNHPLVGKKS